MNKKFLGVFAVLLISIGFLTFNNYAKKEALTMDGVTARAVIEKISSNKHESDIGMDVDNFHVTYGYVVDGREYQKTQEILRHEHDFYFNKTGKKGDSILIKYEPNRPKNSRIEKLTLMSD
ncbi:DUF3592 domain-containing protein [Aquimarina sp. 2304DJ70-9]|uniref:DUF3592 domain-containing protein n=1 Tax=Aquimarina penaris TaxID=3231044 RepID=UPI0034630057